ncbi:MAG: hypothetical protein K8S54_11570 [Spirochaetia bacterium]|nr:hypothetical protein [Spirochaetia bacterium]
MEVEAVQPAQAKINAVEAEMHAAKLVARFLEAHRAPKPQMLKSAQRLLQMIQRVHSPGIP